MLRGSMHYSPRVHRDAEPNPRLQRTWPTFSVSIVAKVNEVVFGNAVPVPKAGHAAEAQCYAAFGPRAIRRAMDVTANGHKAKSGRGASKRSVRGALDRNLLLSSCEWERFDRRGEERPIASTFGSCPDPT